MGKRVAPPTRPLPTPRVRDELLRWFAGQRSSSHEIDSQEIPAGLAGPEIDTLRDSLLGILPTFERLTRRHKVPLAPLLDILARRRLEWRFGKIRLSGAPWSRRKLRMISERLRECAAFLEASTPFLALKSQKELLDEFERRQDDPKALADLTAGASGSEWLERLRTFPWYDLSHGTVNFLEAVAEICDGVPWAKMSFATQKGRPRALHLEAATAKELVEFLATQTDLPLYDHAAVLMHASFPSLQWNHLSSRRMRDWIKQLIASYEPRPPRKGKKTAPRRRVKGR